MGTCFQVAEEYRGASSSQFFERKLCKFVSVPSLYRFMDGFSLNVPFFSVKEGREGYFRLSLCR